MGKRRHIKVNILVTEAFQGARPEGCESAHLNGDRFDNRASNLAWASRRENEAHKALHGTKQMGERQWCRKLNEHSVREIRDADFYRGLYRDLGVKFGVSANLIGKIRRGLGWRHVQ